jgi:hypothetical protein
MTPAQLARSRILRQAQNARRNSTPSLDTRSDSSSSSSESSDDSDDMRIKRPLRTYSTHSSMGSLCYVTPPRRRSPSLEALQRSTSSPSEGMSSRTPSNSENSCTTPAPDAFHESLVSRRRDRKARSNQDARFVSYKRPRRHDCCQVKVPGPSNSDILQVPTKKPKKTTEAASTSRGEQRQQRQSGATYA